VGRGKRVKERGRERGVVWNRADNLSSFNGRRDGNRNGMRGRISTVKLEGGGRGRETTHLMLRENIGGV